MVVGVGMDNEDSVVKLVPEGKVSRDKWRRVGETYVELGKFDPPLWHAPYGRIV